MPRPRKELINLSVTPYYHVTSRCVRRAFLCGQDPLSGRSYEHRKDWIEQRLRLLSSIFAIEVCAYAVMSNHYHLVIRVAEDEVVSWGSEEVMRRWLMLFKGPRVCRRWLEGTSLEEEEKAQWNAWVECYRERLGSISWFMKCLNEPIARQANREDDCRGCFWESRFCSQALLGDRDLLACMAYVDLNPVRAGVAERVERSYFTSIRERLCGGFDGEEAIREQTRLGMPWRFEGELRPLLGFSDEGERGLPFRAEDYYRLVDWTSRQVRVDGGVHLLGGGVLTGDLPPLLDRLQFRRTYWLGCAMSFEDWHRSRHRTRAGTFTGTP